jgi:mannose-6-phosphate isomerase-like protein (cupin superfamily)
MSDPKYLHGPETRETLLDGPIGAILLLGPETSGGHFSLVEHPLAPHALGALVHTHRNEDEYSLVLEGTIGVEVGEETFEAGPGSVVAKPRGVPHAFWNATSEPARILELIVPGGFERYFVELAELFAKPGPPDLGTLAAAAARYELEIDPDSVGRLAEAHNLDVGTGRS